MDCEKCGAEVLEGADTCPECGEPMGALEQAPVDTADAPAEMAEGVADADADAVSEGEEPQDAPSRNRWVVWAIVVGIIAVLGVGAYFAYSAGLFGIMTGNDPGSAATRMLKAYANYDAQGILDNSTHASLQTDGVKDFLKQAEDAKKRANGKPGVKDIRVVSVKIDERDPNKATVEVSGSWLLDPATGEYKAQTQKLQMVKEKGKWLVKLFA